MGEFTSLTAFEGLVLFSRFVTIHMRFCRQVFLSGLERKRIRMWYVGFRCMQRRRSTEYQETTG